MHVEWSDILTVLILVVLEGLLSGDNALVLAVMVLPLPAAQQRKALRYGLIGAFVLRSIATLLAVWLVRVKWVGLLGGIYLLFLVWKHFSHKQEGNHEDDDPARPTEVVIKTILGLSVFWSVVVRVELLDLVFAVDSILAAVALVGGKKGKEWVIITGGLLGIVMMRLLAIKVLELVRRYPKLIDGAYIVIGWVGIKLLWHFAHDFPAPAPGSDAAVWANQFWLYLKGDLDIHSGHHLIPALPEWLAIGMVVVLFTGSFLYARAHAADPHGPDAAAQVFLGGDDEPTAPAEEATEPQPTPG